MRKNYSHVAAHNIKVEYKNLEKSTLIITGTNSNGRTQQITVEVDDYLFPHIISGMSDMVNRKVNTVTNLQKRIKNSIETNHS